MAQEILHHQTLEVASDLSVASSSSRRLNAGAQEFVPVVVQKAEVIDPSPPLLAFNSSSIALASPGDVYYVASGAAAVMGPAGDYYSGGDEIGRGGDGLGISDDVVQKIVKQVEYYFSDINLATTEHLMKFISKDPEGFVPISVIAAFKKIKALIHNNSQLAMALRTSSKLVVSDDEKKVRRRQPLTEADVEELQSRIVVAENLPEDHCYQNLMKVFSAVGNVKTIRTCYPQASSGTTATSALGRPSKLDMLFGNMLHAFVEYETVEDAEKSIVELTDRNWRNGLKLRMLNKCLSKHGQGRGRKDHGELDADDDVSASIHQNEKHVEDPHQLPEASHEHTGEEIPNDKDASKRGGKGRGRGVRGRGRGQHPSNSRGSGHTVATPPTHQHADQPTVHKQPPGPRMPDGTKGFTLGRGKPATSTSSV